MKHFRLPAGIALVGLCAALIVGAGSALAGTAHRAGPARAAAQMPGVAPRTWHVIAGFSQLLPTDTGNTEAVNQFYPRTLTIYAGDKVTWTVNAQNEAHTVTFAPDPVLRHLEDPQVQTSARPGTYTYYCLVHAPLMKGTITVLPAGQ